MKMKTEIILRKIEKIAANVKTADCAAVATSVTVLVTVTQTHSVCVFSLCFALLCFALLCFALLCFALLCFALLCFALPSR